MKQGVKWDKMRGGGKLKNRDKKDIHEGVEKEKRGKFREGWRKNEVK